MFNPLCNSAAKRKSTVKPTRTFVPDANSLFCFSHACTLEYLMSCFDPAARDSIGVLLPTGVRMHLG
jgi:hypothetical protein